MRSVGLDLGTTNSALAVADGGKTTLARFGHAAGESDTFRSILYFHPELRDPSGRPSAVAGPRAIDRYLASEGTGRLIQSMKSYLADRSFQATSIFGRTQSLTDLMTMFLKDLRARSEESVGPLGGRAVVGRPVKFASAKDDGDEALALERLTTALAAAGWDDVTFEYEPVAAAHYYESQLDHDELVLIADFGGGTSDFSLVRVGPSFAASGKERILGSDGVGIAGDALDARVLHHVVAPMLGLGGSYRSMFGRELPVPVWIYGRLLRWHHLSFLKTKKNMELFQEIASQSDEPEKIEALIHVLDNDLGYHLYRSVERAKVALSGADTAHFTFSDPPLVIEADVTRSDFDRWVAEDTQAMAECVDRLLASSGVVAKDVDQVFMTGGTSFVPVVRRIFEERFGKDRLRAGGEMISVATGLSLCAARLS